MKFILYFILLFLTTYLSASDIKTNKGLNESPYVIISIRTDANEYMRALVDGAKLFAKTIGSEDKVIALFNHGNGEKQVQDLQITLDEIGKNAILLMDPNDEAASRMLSNIAKEHKIYFSTLNNKSKDFWPWEFSKYWVTHTVTDAVYSGSAIANEIFNKIGKKGNILVLQGRLDNSTNKGRVQGLKNILKKYPNVNISENDTANWSRAQASILMTNWFSKYKDSDIQGIWAANDEMALGALDIMKEMGLDKKMPICGVDGTGEAVKAVISKDFICTVSVDPYWQSGMGLSFAYQAYLGNIDPLKLPNEKRAFYTKSKLITSKNSKSFLENYINKPPKIDYSKLWEGKYSRPMN